MLIKFRQLIPYSEKHTGGGKHCCWQLNHDSSRTWIIRMKHTQLRPRRRSIAGGCSRRPAVAPHQARRVADRRSATDSRPWTACLSAVVERRQGQTAASGGDVLRRFYRLEICRVRLIRMIQEHCSSRVSMDMYGACQQEKGDPPRNESPF